MTSNPALSKEERGKGAVISVRLPLDDALAFARQAERTDQTVSSYARQLLLDSLQSNWRVTPNNDPDSTGGNYVRVSP